MYATLVPTAGEGEAEETANWEYGEDSKGLPRELGRAGITMSVFSDALFAVADNVGGGGPTVELSEAHTCSVCKCTKRGPGGRKFPSMRADSTSKSQAKEGAAL